jgi:hypothetical protein
MNFYAKIKLQIESQSEKKAEECIPEDKNDRKS